MCAEQWPFFCRGVSARPTLPCPPQVARWLSGCEGALEDQRQMVEASELGLEAAQSRLRAAEAELDFLADSRQVGACTLL